MKLLTEVVRIERVKLKEDDGHRLASLYELARAHLQAEQANEAIELLTGVVRIERVKLKEDDPNRLASLDQLAAAHL